MHAMNPRSARRTMALAAVAMGAALVLIGAAAAGVSLHSRLPIAQRLVLAQANRALSGRFRGTVTVVAVRRFGLGGVDGVDLAVRDPAGQRVATVEGLHARVAAGALAWTLLRGKGEVAIRVDDARVDAIDVALVRGSDGALAIARALEPRQGAPSSAPSRPVSVRVGAVHVARARVQGRLGPFEDLEMGGTLAGRTVLPAEGQRSADATFEGRVGDVPVSLRASLRGDRVEADLGAHPGGGALDLHATSVLGETKTLEASAVVDRVDPRRLFAKAPDGTVHARVRVRAALDARGSVAGELALESDRTTLASQDIPAIEANAQFTGERLSGTAHLHEPGAIADVLFEARYGGGAATVDVDVRADAADLAQLPQLRGLQAHGSAGLRGTGSVDLSARRVDGYVESRITAARVGANEARFAAVRAKVKGSIDGPEVDVDARLEGGRSGGRALPPVVMARAALTFGEGARVTAREVRVETSRGTAPLVVNADRVEIDSGRMDVIGLEATGIGEPVRAEAHVTPRAIALRLLAPAVDLRALTTLLGVRERRGSASLDADFRADRTGVNGHASGSWSSLGSAEQKGGKARFMLNLAGRRVDGTMNVDLDGVHAKASLAHVVLGGPPNEPAAFWSATGAIDVDANIAVAALRPLLPEGERRFPGMGGTVAVRARVARGHRGRAPDVTFDATTRGLSLVVEHGEALKPGRANAQGPAQLADRPWETRGVDVQLTATVDGGSDRVKLRGSLVDRAGLVGQFDVDAHVGIEDLMRAPGDARSQLERAPINAHLEIPMGELARLPAAVRPAGFRGKLGATLDVTGSVHEPRAKLNARAAGLQPFPSNLPTPFDATVEVTYDGRAAIARAVLTSPEGVVLDARGDIDARITDFLAPAPDGPPWDAGATVALHGFPLESVSLLAARGVGGLATGVVALQGLHRDARLDADLRIDRARLGVVCFDDGWLRVHTDTDRTIAETRFEGRGSFAAAAMQAGTRWGPALTPTFATDRPVDATLDAHDFRAASLMPFVEGILNRLDGRLDAHARVHVDPDFKTGTMDGDVRLSHGIVEIPSLGDPLRDVSARITVRPWGTLRVDGVEASGATGHLTASAAVELDGLRLRSATAEVVIPRDQRMPLTVQGVSLGEVSGRVRAQATMSADANAVQADLTLPEVEINLPRASPHSLQSLDPAPDVRVGVRTADGRFVALPLGPPEKPRDRGSTTIHAVAHLGDGVVLRRDTSLYVRLQGSPVLDLTDRVHVNGDFQLAEGNVDVFGKRFRIEPSSTVSFTGDPGKPQLNVSAVYEAADKTRIFADVAGPTSKPKVNLRSDPPHSQDEMLGLLLFGSDQGLAGTPPPDQQPDPTQRAAGLASGVLTEGINKALSGVTSLEISTRVDTSQAANPRPQVDVRLSNDVLASVTVNTGMPAPGAPPDRTLLTVDWRVKPRWSLESTVGDQGSTFVDVLWRHRY
jgi:translocation and assembly module TamB